MSDQEELKKNVGILREKGEQLLKGNISAKEFQLYSRRLGCYAQKETGKFILRLCAAPGDISREYLQLILKYAREQGLEQVCLTTKQSVQLEGLSIDAVCGLLMEAGRDQTKGVRLSPLAGVDREEPFDVTPYAVLADEYLAEKTIPGKLKVAFSSSLRDTAGAAAADLGFTAAEQDGRPYFAVFLAGGLGTRPALGIEYPKPAEPEKMLYYVEAMVRLIRGEGEAPGTAARRMGKDAFLKSFDQYLAQAEEESLKEQKAEPVPYEPWESRLEMEDVVIPEKQDKKYTVVLHPQNGQMAVNDLKELTDFLDFHEHARLRLSLNQDFLVSNVTKKAAEMLIDGTCEYNCVDRAGKTVCCTGGASCAKKVADIRSLSLEIAETLREEGLEDVLPKLSISGCSHGCARHLAAGLGLCRRVKEEDGAVCYELYVGGKSGENGALAEKAGTFSSRELPGLFLKMAKGSE